MWKTLGIPAHLKIIIQFISTLLRRWKNLLKTIDLYKPRLTTNTVQCREQPRSHINPIVDASITSPIAGYLQTKIPVCYLHLILLNELPYVRGNFHLFSGERSPDEAKWNPGSLRCHVWYKTIVMIQVTYDKTEPNPLCHVFGA